MNNSPLLHLERDRGYQNSAYTAPSVLSLPVDLQRVLASLSALLSGQCAENRDVKGQCVLE